MITALVVGVVIPVGPFVFISIVEGIQSRLDRKRYGF